MSMNNEVLSYLTKFKTTSRHTRATLGALAGLTLAVGEPHISATGANNMLTNIGRHMNIDLNVANETFNSFNRIQTQGTKKVYRPGFLGLFGVDTQISQDLADYVNSKSFVRDFNRMSAIIQAIQSSNEDQG